MWTKQLARTAARDQPLIRHVPHVTLQLAHKARRSTDRAIGPRDSGKSTKVPAANRPAVTQGTLVVPQMLRVSPGQCRSRTVLASFVGDVPQNEGWRCRLGSGIGILPRDDIPSVSSFLHACQDHIANNQPKKQALAPKNNLKLDDGVAQNLFLASPGARQLLQTPPHGGWKCQNENSKLRIGENWIVNQKRGPEGCGCLRKI